MKNRLLALSILFITTISYAQEWTSRTVTYDPKDIVTIPTKIRFTTVVVLPESERIIDFVVGDKAFWVIEGIENFAYIKPSKAGASTNVTLITETAKLYSFVLNEVSEADGTPDLKVFIQDSEPELAPARPRFVRVEEADELRDALVQVVEDAEKDKERFRRNYGKQLHFVYKFKENKEPFYVSAIYHDGKFTYIRSDAQEKPALYEYTEDNGTLNLVNFQMEDGLYVVPKVLDRGRLSIGKKKLDFERTH
jgi:type IV secretion system protein VirB9